MLEFSQLTREVILLAKRVPLEQAKKEDISYLMYPYIPFGVPTIFQGQAGFGKTRLVCKIMAEASRGVYPPRLRRGEIHGRIETTEWQKYCIEKAMLPPETAWIDASTVESTEQNGMTIDGIDTETDEELTKDNPPMDNPFFRPVGEPIKTTYITRENHYGNIIRKLYEDNGGRPGYVTIIDETDEPFVITREKVATAIGDSKLLVLDPVYPFIDGDLSSNKSVARAMDTLEVVAHETGAAILLLNNLTKYNTSDYSSGLGASNLKNIARSLFKLDRQGPLLYLEGIKNNFARYDGRIGILMDDFGRPDYINYNQMMREVELMQKDEETGEFSPARQRAADFIMNLLANGPVDSNEVKEAADQEGIPMSTLNEVKKMLGIRSQRTKGNSAVWVLPD